MRTLARIRHLAVTIFLVSCAGDAQTPPGNETMSRILAEMIETNQQNLPADTLAVRRAELFEKHGTNEKEVRAWIETARTHPDLSQHTAQRVSALMDSTASPVRPPTYGK